MCVGGASELGCHQGEEERKIQVPSATGAGGPVTFAFSGADPTPFFSLSAATALLRSDDKSNVCLREKIEESGAGTSMSRQEDTAR